MSDRRAPDGSPAERARPISDFYAAHAHRLRALVGSKTGAPSEAVADACQSAWVTLLRRPDINLDARGLAWLTVVAVHEVHHHWRDRTRNLPMGALSLGTGDPGELDEPAATGEAGVEELATAHLEHAERVGDLAVLKPAERTALYLQALGYRYREIAVITDASYTAVNRRLTEGRARLRRTARERDQAAQMSAAQHPGARPSGLQHDCGPDERAIATRQSLAPVPPALSRSRDGTPSVGPGLPPDPPHDISRSPAAFSETHSLLATDSRRLNE